jgi:hypothetical protein
MFAVAFAFAFAFAVAFAFAFAVAFAFAFAVAFAFAFAVALAVAVILSGAKDPDAPNQTPLSDPFQPGCQPAVFFFNRPNPVISPNKEPPAHQTPAVRV